MQKGIEAEKNGYKDCKILRKLIHNAFYSKAMKTLRNRIGVKLTGNEKDF